MSQSIVESDLLSGEAARGRVPRAPSELCGFELVYRANCAAVTAFFARRSRDPQTVADLTADTFVEALRSYGGFDATKGGARPWLIGIARHVFAKHCDRAARQEDINRRVLGQGVVDADETEELLCRIDAERAGRELIERLSHLSPLEREAIDLVDIAGMTPKEVASALGVSAGVLRARLFRARTRLRKES
jgi:RNA polymerase sigma factor (sigma-70 family)